jgi:hypothetical protein
MRRTRLVMGLLWLIACGDDAGGTSDAGDSPEGEPCAQQGQTDTGCTCEEPGSVGVRSCTAERVWTPCTCPPVSRNEPCTPGEPIVCSPCEGERDPRRGVCREGGTAQCPACDTSSGDAGAADGG